jgi:transposase InsO family protein
VTYPLKPDMDDTDGLADDQLVELIQTIQDELPRYGYRRITHELRRRGHVVNHKRVVRLMKAHNLSIKPRRRFVRTTDSDHGPVREVHSKLESDFGGIQRHSLSHAESSSFECAHPPILMLRKPNIGQQRAKVTKTKRRMLLLGKY